MTHSTPQFRDLFRFLRKEVEDTFGAAKISKRIPGLKLLKAPGLGMHGKMLIIIPRRTGDAHVRNKIRRQIKAIFFEQQLYTNPTTWILLVYKDATKLSFNELQQFLVKSCTQQPPKPAEAVA